MKENRLRELPNPNTTTDPVLKQGLQSTPRADPLGQAYLKAGWIKHNGQWVSPEVKHKIDQRLAEGRTIMDQTRPSGQDKKLEDSTPVNHMMPWPGKVLTPGPWVEEESKLKKSIRQLERWRDRQPHKKAYYNRKIKQRQKELLALNAPKEHTINQPPSTSPDSATSPQSMTAPNVSPLLQRTTQSPEPPEAPPGTPLADWDRAARVIEYVERAERWIMRPWMTIMNVSRLPTPRDRNWMEDIRNGTWIRATSVSWVAEKITVLERERLWAEQKLAEMVMILAGFEAWADTRRPSAG